MAAESESLDRGLQFPFESVASRFLVIVSLFNEVKYSRVLHKCEVVKDEFMSVGKG